MSPCNSSGVSIIMTSAHFAASATSITLKPAVSAFFADAGILQVQRVGMALAAIADDADLLALDEVQVGVAIVINTHGRSSWLAGRSARIVMFSEVGPSAGMPVRRLP